MDMVEKVKLISVSLFLFLMFCQYVARLFGAFGEHENKFGAFIGTTLAYSIAALLLYLGGFLDPILY